MKSAPHVEACGPRDAEAPFLDDSDYKNQFKYTIRLAPRHEGFLSVFREDAQRVLPSVSSYIETDLSDKALEMRRILEPLTEEDESHLFDQYAGRLASTLAVDEMLGRLILELKGLGELDRTVLIFTSDNGWHYGEHRLSGKSRAYEESIRVPLFVRLPNHIQAVQRDHIVLNNELVPTILTLAKVPIPASVDGRSLSLIWEGNPMRWRERFLVEHYLSYWPFGAARVADANTFFGVRTSDRLYVKYFWGIPKKDSYYWNRFQSRPVRTFIWETEPVDTELYHLAEDPYQLANLVRTRPGDPTVEQETQSMNEFLLELITCLGQACRQAED